MGDTVTTWVGRATATAQVDTFTPANVEINDIFILTATAEDGLTTHEVSFTATAATAANVSENLIGLWNADTHPLCQASLASGTVTVVLTAKTAGAPFYVASTETQGGGADDQTFTRAATTVSSGPNDFNIAANWDTGAVPVATDDIRFVNNSVDCLYGLDQSAKTFDTLFAEKSYTGLLGQAEYPLHAPCDEHVKFGEYYGSTAVSGSKRINYNAGTVEPTVGIYVYDTAQSSQDAGLPPVRITATQANTDVYVKKGRVGFAVNTPTETATFNFINVSYVDNKASDAVVEIGPGVTVSDVTGIGGDVTIRCTAAISGALTVHAGTYNLVGGGAIATIETHGGVVIASHSGGSTAVNIYGGFVDATRSDFARTIGTVTFKEGAWAKGGQFAHDAAVMTLTNDVVMEGRNKIVALAV